MDSIDIATDVAMVVTTSFRGVFFGYGKFHLDGSAITLTRARMCLTWPVENRGVLGLSTQGPLKGARVGPAAPVIILTGVTALAKCTDEAIRRWETAPWNT